MTTAQVNNAPIEDDEDDWLDRSSGFALDEGWYDAQLIDVEDRAGNYGACLRWVFSFPNLDPALVVPDDFTVSRITSRKFSNGKKGPSKAYLFITALNDGSDQVGSRRHLFGRRCRLRLGVNDAGYNVIEEIKPPRSAAKPAPKPSAAPKPATVTAPPAEDDEWDDDEPSGVTVF